MAQAPGWEACEHFGAHRVLQGMQCLSADRLQAALEQAISQTASHFGVARSRIEQMIDRERASALLAGVRAHQPTCEQMARDHGASLTSFVVERVTISAGAVAYLSALAGRFADDHFIAEPVRRLGEMIGQWEALLDSFGDRLDADRSIGAARVRKLAIRGAAALALLSVIGALASWAGWSRFVVQRSQHRIGQLLDGTDPCAVASVPSADLRHARNDQLMALEDRKRRCTALKEKQAHEEACASLAAKVEAGGWEPADGALAGNSAPLLARMSARALIAADLTPGPDALPCQETAAGPKLWTALARVAAGSEKLWASADRVSPRLVELMTGPELALSEASRQALTSHAESSSRRAIVVGLPDALDRARALCALQASLRVPWERGCKAVDRLPIRR